MNYTLRAVGDCDALPQSCASSDEVPVNFIGASQPSFEAKFVAGAVRG